MTARILLAFFIMWLICLSNFRCSSTWMPRSFHSLTLSVCVFPSYNGVWFCHSHQVLIYCRWSYWHIYLGEILRATCLTIPLVCLYHLEEYICQCYYLFPGITWWHLQRGIGRSPYQLNLVGHLYIWQIIADPGYYLVMFQIYARQVK